MSAPRLQADWTFGARQLTPNGGVVPLTTLISSFVGAQRSENSGRVIENREIS
jgi:hypothetical protein